jgi:hypothetical protein
MRATFTGSYTRLNIWFQTDRFDPRVNPAIATPARPTFGFAFNFHENLLPRNTTAFSTIGPQIEPVFKKPTRLKFLISHNPRGNTVITLKSKSVSHI